MKTHEALQRAREVIRRQHKALATEDTYLFWLRHYIQALRAMPPELPSEKKLERFLTDLARSREVSASTQNQALNAVLFFYRDVLGQPLGNIDALRANRPVHERHAPSRSETQLLLQNVRNENGYPTNLVARMLYGCGMRVSEPLNLRDSSIFGRLPFAIRPIRVACVPFVPFGPDRKKILLRRGGWLLPKDSPRINKTPWKIFFHWDRICPSRPVQCGAKIEICATHKYSRKAKRPLE